MLKLSCKGNHYSPFQLNLSRFVPETLASFQVNTSKMPKFSWKGKECWPLKLGLSTFLAFGRAESTATDTLILELNVIL